MLRLASLRAGVGARRQLQAGAWATARGMATGTEEQEGLASKLRHTAEAAAHTAEEVVHKVEEVVHRAEEAVLSPLHKAQHFVHEHREHAREEAERGMFTADDIREAEALRAEAEAAHRRPLRGPHQEGLAEKLKHKAEDVVHRAEEAVLNPVHKAQQYVREHREHAREEAERGMFTADDIREAAAQMAEARGGDQRIVRSAVETETHATHKRREKHPDSDEELLEEATQDFQTPARQQELKGLQDLVKEDRNA